MILLFLLFSAPQAQGQGQGQSRYAKEIYNAYVSGNMDKWSSVIATMERENSTAISDRLELAGYYYGYIGHLISKGRKADVEKYLPKAEKLVDKILAADPKNATALAYQGSLIAYSIALNKLKAPVLGPKSMQRLKAAYAADPGNVQALADMGNMYYHAPGIFGGNKPEGLKYLERAVKRIETLKGTENNWMYLNLMVLLGQYYQETDNKQGAISIYEKILKVEPNMKWVKEELYPNAKKK